MSRRKIATRKLRYRSQKLPAGRSLRFETMEGRLVLSASGFTGNECAPEIDDAALDAIAPSQISSPQSPIAFQFKAEDIVSDAGEGATAVKDILFSLDPDIGSRSNGATPSGATLSFNDQGNADEADDRWEFSWTPNETQVGSFRLFLIATDDGGTANVPLSDVYTFTLEIDNRPTVDLNGGDDSGIDFGPVSFTEANDSSPVSIVDSDLSIPFAENDTVASATVQLVDPQADGLEELSIDAGASLVVDSSTPGTLVITVDGGGVADKSLFEAALRTLTYNNTSDNPESTRTINVTINDGTADSETAVATVNIESTNDRPNLTLNGSPADAKVGVEYVLPLVATDPDNGDLLTFRLVDGPAGAVISPLPAGGSDITEQISADQDGFYRAEIRWTPTAEQVNSNPLEFLVVATDSGGLVDSKLYEVSIENQNPVAVDDPTSQDDPNYSTDEDMTLNVNTRETGILANDTDDDGNAGLTVAQVNGSAANVGAPIIVTDGSGRIGQLTVNADGTFTYVPGNSFDALSVEQSSQVTFTYVASDGSAVNPLSNEATVTISIAGLNDPPVFDLDNNDGLASTLPTGDLQSAKVIAVELDLSSTDPNINSLNLVNIPMFTSDIDGDSVGITLADGDNGGTPFRNENLPTLNASSQLVWVPTAEDIGEGYVIRVQAEDQPAMGDALSDSFDIVVSVISGIPSVESVSGINVALDVSQIAVAYSESMGSTAFDLSNYSLKTLDGDPTAGTPVSILSVTQNGASGVILELSDPTITDLSNDGVTKLQLSFDPQIADDDGNMLEGPLNFEIDLLTELPV